MELIVSLTGASGVIYGLRLLEVLKSIKGHNVHLIISENAKKLIEFETELDIEDVLKNSNEFYKNSDLSAIIASGSKMIDAMVIIPCSMSTAAKINAGIADNLIVRTADVCLKEKRRLILVPRETPINTTHLTNLLSLSQKGVLILPAMPGFYHKPQVISDQVDFIVGKVLDNLRIPHKLYRRWGGV